MTPQICDCGICLTCKSRERGRKWREAHPGAKKAHRAQMREFRQTHPQVRKGPFVHPTAARMDRIADEVWARHAAPWYYAPAAERFRGWGPTAGVMRVEAL